MFKKNRSFKITALAIMCVLMIIYLNSKIDVTKYNISNAKLPEKKLFPKYDAGKFTIGDSVMIVNRGIGNSSVNVRIFNKPEIGVIKL